MPRSASRTAAAAARQHCAKRRAFPRPRHLVGDKVVALVERNDAGALHELRHARRRILNEIFDLLPERGMGCDPSHAPARHRPILGEGVDEEDAILGRHDIVEGWCARTVPVPEAGIGLVGDDPESMPAGDREQRREVVAARGPSGGIRRRDHHERPRARADGGREPIEIERPALIAEIHRHRTGRAPVMPARRPHSARPASDDHLSPSPAVMASVI